MKATTNEKAETQTARTLRLRATETLPQMTPPPQPCRQVQQKPKRVLWKLEIPMPENLLAIVLKGCEEQDSRPEDVIRALLASCCNGVSNFLPKARPLPAEPELPDATGVTFPRLAGCD